MEHEVDYRLFAPFASSLERYANMNKMNLLYTKDDNVNRCVLSWYNNGGFQCLIILEASLPSAGEFTLRVQCTLPYRFPSAVVAVFPVDIAPDAFWNMLNKAKDMGENCRPSENEKGKSALDAYLEQLTTTDNPQIRRMAAEELGRLGDYRAVDALIQASKDDSEWVRLSAVKALGLLKMKGRISNDNDVLARLQQAVEDPSIYVREAAKQALREFAKI